ncbi:hypothetical protein [Enterococcus rivorum]|uniref:hypothetical protein n=1 Tax=Enterococcus rivorum TaxID=762845 RepID=UPI00363DA73E
MSDPKEYFKQPVFHLLGKELLRRYWLKGAFGNSVGLSLFSKVDTDPLRSFLGLTVLSWDQKKRIQIVDLEQAFIESILEWSLSDFVVSLQRNH